MKEPYILALNVRLKELKKLQRMNYAPQLHP